jgi:hypothetical protein
MLGDIKISEAAILNRKHIAVYLRRSFLKSVIKVGHII